MEYRAKARTRRGAMLAVFCEFPLLVMMIFMVLERVDGLVVLAMTSAIMAQWIGAMAFDTPHEKSPEYFREVMVVFSLIFTCFTILFVTITIAAAL